MGLRIPPCLLFSLHTPSKIHNTLHPQILCIAALQYRVNGRQREKSACIEDTFHQLVVNAALLYRVPTGCLHHGGRLQALQPQSSTAEVLQYQHVNYQRRQDFSSVFEALEGKRWEAPSRQPRTCTGTNWSNIIATEIQGACGGAYRTSRDTKAGFTHDWSRIQGPPSWITRSQVTSTVRHTTRW